MSGYRTTVIGPEPAYEWVSDHTEPACGYAYWLAQSG